ncbi:hypothetical protein [Campylobacter concisus]|nr:hypothetical protein [Campylobacter concisus]
MISGVIGDNAKVSYELSSAQEGKEADIMGLLRKFSKIGLNVKV